MKKLLALSFIVLFYLPVFSQDLSLFKKQLFTSNGDTLPYRLLLPHNYDAKKTYPLVFFLHGAGERGSDNEAQLTHGSKLFLREEVRKNFPAIVVFPQCPKQSFWSNVAFSLDTAGRRVFGFDLDNKPTTAMVLAQGLLDKLMISYKVEKTQVYIAGLSMGGMGTFEMAGRNPMLFAAAIPICGGASPSTAPLLKTTSWWIFHGAKDDVVPPYLSRQMYEALQKENADAKLTMYPEANHNSWDLAFEEKDFLPWLFSKHRK